MNVQANFADGFEGMGPGQETEVYTSGSVLGFGSGRTGGQAAVMPQQLARTLGAHAGAFYGLAWLPVAGGMLRAQLTTAGVTQLEARWDTSTGIVGVYRGDGALIASVLRSYNAGAWYGMLLAAIAKNDATGRVWLTIAGTVVIDLTGVQTALAGVTTYDGVRADASNTSRLDDQYARFGSGVTVEDASLGHLALVEALPTAQGFYAGWNADAGAGGNPNYTRYDEPVDDGDLTYVESQTPSDRDSWLPTVPSTIGTVRFLMQRAIARLVDVGTPRQIRFFTRDGGGNHDSAIVHDVPSGNFLALDEFLFTNPGTGSPWTGSAEINATQQGFKLDS
jgi:hypothetical protein